MPMPFLLAQTPRAGELNHRFICSPGAGLTDEAARELLADVIDKADPATNSVAGTTYVAAIRRGVFQMNSDRKGDEVLVLGGVDPTRLDPTVAARLEALLYRMGDVVNAVGQMKGLLVEHSEFSRWLEELRTPPKIAAEPPGNSSDKSNGTKAILVAGFGLAIAVAGIFLYLNRNDRSGDSTAKEPANGTSSVGTTQPEPESAVSRERMVEDIRSRLGAPSLDALENDMKRVLGPDGNSKIGRIFNDLQRGDPIATLEYVGPDRLALLQLFPDPKLPLREAQRARAVLACWQSHLPKLRILARKAKFHTYAKRISKPTLGLLAELAKDGAYRTIENEEPRRSPVLPWFAPDEEAFVGDLGELLVQSAAGKRFSSERLGLNEPTLKEILDACPLQSKRLRETLEDERRAILSLQDPETHPQTKSPMLFSKPTLNPVIDAFDRFIDDLRKLPSRGDTSK